MRNRSRIELDRICAEARKERAQYRAKVHGERIQIHAEWDQYKAGVRAERDRIRAEWRRGR